MADAIVRPALSKHPKLRSKWICAYSAANHCKDIRNQYAHCHWQSPDGKLHFLDLDDEAKSHDDQMPVMTVSYRPIDLTLLEKQYQYFEYAVGYMYYVRDQLILLTGGQPKGQPYPEPKSIPRPPRDNRRATVAPSRAAKTARTPSKKSLAP